MSFINLIKTIFTGTGGAPTEYTLGVDVSHWQGRINFQRMKDQGIKFVIMKATDVGDDTKKPFIDDTFVDNYYGAKSVGLLTGAYCWLDPRYDPTLQARFYLDEIYYKYPTDAQPIMDFEDKNVISWNDMLWRGQKWLDVAEKEIGTIPIIYTAKWYMDYFDQNKASFLSRYPLWTAHYIRRTYPTISSIWSDWKIWQYTSSGNYPYHNSAPLTDGRYWGVSSSGLDMNWFKGNYGELLAFFNGEETTPPEEPPSYEPAPDVLYYPVDEGKWYITQYFGERPNIYTTSKGHNGIDFGTLVGSKVYATNDGVVSESVDLKQKTGYGRHIRIKHKDGTSIYGHLSKRYVNIGDVVKARQLIGLTGGAFDDPYSGYSTGPHLHFEFRLNDPADAPQVPGGYVYGAIDPMPLLASHTYTGKVIEPLFKAKCIVSALNTRYGSGTSYYTNGKLYKDNVVSVYKESNNWFKISDKSEVWCSGYPQYMQRIGELPSGVLFQAKCIAGALNVRSGAGVENSIIRQIKNGDIVNVYEIASNGWYRIEKDKQEWCSGSTAYMVKVQN